LNTGEIWHLADDKAGTPPAYVLPTAHFGNGPAASPINPASASMNTRITFSATDFTSTPGQQRHGAWLQAEGGELRSRGPEKVLTNMVPTDASLPGRRVLLESLTGAGTRR